jgi:hypothetical protein
MLSIQLPSGPYCNNKFHNNNKAIFSFYRRSTDAENMDAIKIILGNKTYLENVSDKLVNKMTELLNQLANNEKLSM